MAVRRGTGFPMPVLIPDELGLELIASHPRLRAIAYRPDSDAADLSRAEAMVVGMRDSDAAATLLEQLPAVEFVQTLAAGYEGWVGRLPKGVTLMNGSGAHGAPVAEWIAAILLAHRRDLYGFAAAQRDAVWRWREATTLDGLRVLVLGAGDIAKHTRRLLEPFGCVVTLTGRTAREGVIALADADPSVADVVVVALPQLPSTIGLVDREFLARMPDGSTLINAGRGKLVDTDALLAEQGRINALLDVTDPEPLPDGHPLWSAPNVVITPHVAGTTPGTWARAWHVALDNLDRWARGEAFENLDTGAA